MVHLPSACHPLLCTTLYSTLLSAPPSPLSAPPYIAYSPLLHPSSLSPLCFTLPSVSPRSTLPLHAPSPPLHYFAVHFFRLQPLLSLCTTLLHSPLCSPLPRFVSPCCNLPLYALFPPLHYRALLLSTPTSPLSIPPCCTLPSAPPPPLSVNPVATSPCSPPSLPWVLPCSSTHYIEARGGRGEVILTTITINYNIVCQN